MGLTSRMMIIGGLLVLSAVAWGRAPPTTAASLQHAGEGPDNKSWIDFEVKPGDSLSLLFSRAGLPASDWRDLLKLGGKVNALRHLQPGDILGVRKAANGRLAALRYQSRRSSTPLLVQRSGGRFATVVALAPPIPYPVRISGHVRRTLVQALQRAGASRSVAYEFIDIFRPRIDPARSVAAGDRFAFIYDRYYAGHRFVKSGPILAAEITLDGETLTAFRYTDGHGRSAYYNQDGLALKPAILRAPLRYTQVSSPFSMNRMDPVVHVRRPHNGVDLAAPKGTPIKAAADGRVKFIGRAGGYGELIILKNFGPYSTRYAHMLRFADGVHTGSRVRRGQVIGYVGESGEATGPHLHFEIRVDGTPRNPLTVKLPPAKPIPAGERFAFQQTVSPLMAELGRAYGRGRTLFAGDDSYGLSNEGCPPSSAFRPAITFAPIVRPESSFHDGSQCEP